MHGPHLYQLTTSPEELQPYETLRCEHLNYTSRTNEGLEVFRIYRCQTILRAVLNYSDLAYVSIGLVYKRILIFLNYCTLILLQLRLIHSHDAFNCLILGTIKETIHKNQNISTAVCPYAILSIRPVTPSSCPIFRPSSHPVLKYLQSTSDLRFSRQEL